MANANSAMKRFMGYGNNLTTLKAYETKTSSLIGFFEENPTLSLRNFVIAPENSKNDPP